MMAQSGAVCQFLGEKIRGFVLSRDESYRWFSKQAKVDYSTIYRLQAGEQKSVSFVNALKIMRVIEPINYLSILGDFFTEEVKETKSTEAKSKADDLLRTVVNDIHLYRVYLFVAATNATETSVKEKYGETGIEMLESLQSLGVVSKNGERYEDNLKGMTYPSEDILKRMAANHLEMISLERPGSSLQTLRGNLSEEGLKQWYQATEDYRIKLHQIIDNNSGQNVVAAAFVIGRAE
jgi:hypothetical protein